MRLLLSGGGTGGHVYPILAVVAALQSAPPTPASPASFAASAHQYRYVGAAGGVEASLAARANIDFVAIRAGQLRIHNPIKLMRNALWLMQGALQARRIVAQWRPDVLFVTGGYVCAPVVWAAQRHRVPILIYLPDITPGLAVQKLARYADRVAVTFPEVSPHFPGKAVVTGYPIRPELRTRPLSRPDARRLLDLAPDLPTFLVFGGSRGSRNINQALAASLDSLLQTSQVIHITGELDWAAAQTRAGHLKPDQRRRYRAFPYLHDDMITALCAADMAIARAGASTLGEFPALGLPAILVPLPISGQHQLPNARYLADRDAAIILEDSSLAAQLWPTLQALLQDPSRLTAMSLASAALAQPAAADHIAQLLIELGT